jgi:glutathione synthase/RimK-type ligase-like ATP-grasp enzyme
MKTLLVKDNYNGPLIGIMTAKKRSGAVTGNVNLFKELQKKLISLGGISFIFTIEGVNDDLIEGYTFQTENYRWVKVIAPYPDLVYNRIPFRKSEQNSECQKFFSTLKTMKIPFFNPCFIDKYELYCLLENHAILQKYLPKTMLANQKKALSSFLHKLKRIYLKPAQSAKGIGIFRLVLMENKQIKLNGLTKEESYQNFDDFWNKWEKELIEKNYLAQEEIISATFEGHRYDFRIIAHAEQTEYKVTGVGIRQSHAQDITTHIPAGGRLLPYQLFQKNEHDQFIQTIVSQIGHVLSEQLSFFGEFSIDACLSSEGSYYLFEVNSKPMSFDETEIEEQKIAQLCRLFFQLTDH